MILHNDLCSINISIDTTYTVESTDNKPYDLIINPGNLKRSDMYKVFSVQINLFSKTINIALIGDYYSYDEDCAVLEDTILTILQNDAIIQLNVNDGTMINYKEFDCFGCNYGIYRVQNGYIIDGELEITMLDFEFHKKWSFSGKDIFVSISDKKAFELCENSIKLYDF
ncbi:MAG: hypothetical protein Q4B86_08585, partial [Eubacteriales bacterium]|nr:hypothetical protein [Eubacteriales bacterium]